VSVALSRDSVRQVLLAVRSFDILRRMCRWLLAPVAVLLVGCGARSGLGDLSASSTGVVDSAADAVTIDDATLEVGTGIDSASETTVSDSAPHEDALSDASSDVATACPPSLPRAGDPCSVAAPCLYPGCDATKSDSARCVGGVWTNDVSSCLTTSDVCPIVRPPPGTKCTAPDGILCFWPDGTCGYRYIGWCQRGVWVAKGGCSLPECAPTLPGEGTPCTPPGSICWYPNECGAPVVPQCIAGLWHIEPASCSSPVTGCPPTLPTAGSSAPPFPPFLTCVYPNACGSYDVATNGPISRGWNIIPGRCTDHLCPPSGDLSKGCSTEGLACVYPGGGSCTLNCTCGTGRWACSQICTG
jgi:hypothetical protein